MTHYENLVRARLADILALAESGFSEDTGTLKRRYDGPGAETVTRWGGLNIPELLRARLTPKRGALAIRRGKGKPFLRIVEAVRYYLGKEGHWPPRKRSAGKPTVPAHRALTRKCKTCKVAHAKGPHRFHGEGSFHNTHLFAFNPMKKRKRNPEKPALGASEAERRRLMYGGRRTDLLKDKKTFDKTRLEESPLFAPTKAQGEMFKKNPQGARVIYGRLLRIEAQKTQPHRCDAECKKFNHKYFHPFKGGAVVYGLANGDLYIRSRK